MQVNDEVERLQQRLVWFRPVLPRLASLSMYWMARAMALVVVVVLRVKADLFKQSVQTRQ